MVKNIIKRVFSVFLALIFLSNCSLYAYASEHSDTTYTKASPEYTNVYWGDGYIVEQTNIAINGSNIYFTRTSYENNTTVLEIIENGVKTTTSHSIDYTKLYQNLKGNQIDVYPSTRGRVDGYTYTFMRTISQTVEFKPEYKTYSAFLAILSKVLSNTGIPGATLASIASALVRANAGDGNTKIELYRHWYNVTETSSGAYICYYCECNAYTYAKVTGGDWVYVGSEYWDFNSFDIY